MLVILGIDSQFAMVEVVITSVKDSFEHVLSTKSVRHEFVVLFVCLVSFLAGLPNLFEGGIYFFQIIDYYTVELQTKVHTKVESAYYCFHKTILRHIAKQVLTPQ